MKRSRVLKLYPWDYIPGELQIAAIITEGGAVTPPRGWKEVPGTDQSSMTGERLQVFYGFPISLNTPDEGGPYSYSFTTTTAQAMTGTMTDFIGANQSQPINASAGEVAMSASGSVSAPSITPSARNAMLLFIGATGSPQEWRTPTGMSLSHGLASQRTAIEVAYQRWRLARASGTRTAGVSAAGEGIGDLIAVSYPAPLSCPKVTILTHGGGRSSRLALKATSHGIISLRLRCAWSAPCVGALGLFDIGTGTDPGFPPQLAGGDISLPSRGTRTVQIATCGRGSECSSSAGRKALRQGGVTPVRLLIILREANGQLVSADYGSRELQLP